MALRSITREAFDGLGPSMSPLAASAAEQAGWWADDAGRLLGFVARDRRTGEYLWVVQGRDERGQFRTLTVGSHVDSFTEARERLVSEMRGVEGVERLSFPHIEFWPNPDPNTLWVALNRLHPREAEALRLHVGLDGNASLPHHEIGARFGITEERVRSVLKKAVRKLWRVMEAAP